MKQRTASSQAVRLLSAVAEISFGTVVHSRRFSPGTTLIEIPEANPAFRIVWPGRRAHFCSYAVPHAKRAPHSQEEYLSHAAEPL